MRWGEGEGYTLVAEWRAGHERFGHSAQMREALGDPEFMVGVARERAGRLPLSSAAVRLICGCRAPCRHPRRAHTVTRQADSTAAAAGLAPRHSEQLTGTRSDIAVAHLYG
jgi:hypothetical protein